MNKQKLRLKKKRKLQYNPPFHSATCSQSNPDSDVKSNNASPEVMKSFEGACSSTRRRENLGLVIFVPSSSGHPHWELAVCCHNNETWRNFSAVIDPVLA